ncbi:MAG: LacI family transcriptional regulator [Roseomonas sp.]|jgi:tripartite-type tricarboxylate transporter receptor subunit TctC|nr:LacI family transcriptional regulator [Roseomonas sp.]
MLTRRQAALVGLTGFAARDGWAQPAFPSRPITLVMPFAAGGGSDFVSRVVAAGLSARLRQPITIDNRGGAGGNIGFAAGARAAPDGYTLTTLTQNIAANPHLYANMPFDPLKDFHPLSIMTEVSSVMIVRSSLPIRSVPELIAYAQANPGKLSAGNGGLGGQTHLTIAYLCSLAGIDITQVSYRGEGPVLNDLLGGQLGLTVQGFGGLDIKEHLLSGALRAIAVTSAQRSPLLPDVPTVAESLPGFVIVGWYGLAAPAATPAHITGLLGDALRATLREPEISTRLSERGLRVVANDSNAFMAIIRADHERYGKLIAGAGIKPQ